MRKDEFINYLMHLADSVRDGMAYESDVKETAFSRDARAKKREIAITFQDATGERSFLNIIDARLPRDIEF